MKHDRTARALHRHATTVAAFTAWLSGHADDLIDAADLLGGRRWVARAEGLVHTVQQEADPADRVGDLRALRRLLHLELADRPGSDEEARFACVHPDDPRADTARRCAEALDRGIAAIEALARAGGVKMREAA